MTPKKIYLNYVDENDDEKTWSEEPVSVTDCDLHNREYTDLSQVWHDASEEPQKYPILYQDEFGNVYVQQTLKDYVNWVELKELEYVKRWAYICDLLPKGGEQ